MRILTALALTAFVFPGFTLAAAPAAATANAASAVQFNAAFECASLGKIDKLSENEFRIHMLGQQDSRGRNRQATWFFFRMDNVAGRELTLHFTDFVGEYNGAPSRAPVSASYRPWFSEDNTHWDHVESLAWDAAKDEATFTLRPRGNTIWLAHVPPYPYTRLQHLLEEIGSSPLVRVEVIGRSAHGRDLNLVTINDLSVPDENKKVIFLIARQHPWETGTSIMAEGAMRFLLSDDPVAQQIRRDTIVKVMPMMNPDGVAEGAARFNVNGYDTNREWDLVDLRDKQWLTKMPEIWYVKTRVFAEQARQPIALLVNLHQDESNEYMDTMVDAEPGKTRIDQLFAILAEKSLFDPSRKRVTTIQESHGPTNTTLSLWTDAHVPTVMIERRVTAGLRTKRIYTFEDNQRFGEQLIATMAEVARDKKSQP
ncbi:MAG TPA: M14-type cytosolic carboxypeptidase [Opitutaceae bacterium]|nr:M14-type cytosolic carboxypeptidase [Opitutaceae bacterium]